MPLCKRCASDLLSERCRRIAGRLHAGRGGPLICWVGSPPHRTAVGTVLRAVSRLSPGGPLSVRSQMTFASAARLTDPTSVQLLAHYAVVWRQIGG